MLQQATKTEFESHLAAQIEELLPHGESALGIADGMLKSNRYRGTNSPLYLQEARVRFAQRRFPDALALLDEGLRFASESRDLLRILDLLCLKSWVLEEAQRWDELGAALKYLWEYAQRLDHSLASIQHWAQKIRLARWANRQEEVAAAATELSRLLPNLSEQDFLSIAPLLKGIFSYVTPLTSEPLRKFALTIGYARLDPSLLEELLPYLQKSMGETSWKPFAQLRPEDLRSGDLIANGLRRLLEQPKDDKVTRELAEVIDQVVRFWPYRLPYLPRPSSQVS